MEFTDFSSFLQLLFRWIHFVAGITWIGILYFFNLVNVNFMKSIDAPTKGKVVPNMLAPALWYFRWGAVFTVLSGLTYFAVWIVGNAGSQAPLGPWLVWVLLSLAVLYICIEVLKIISGLLLAGIFTVVVIALSFLVVHHTGLGSTRSICSGIGGGIGILMLLNVWGIIWRQQKKIIAW